MYFLDKLSLYVVPVISSGLLIVLWWRSRRDTVAHNKKYILGILAVGVAAHLYTVIIVGYKIYYQLGYQALPPYNQYLLTEAQSGIVTMIVAVLHAALWFFFLWYLFLRRGKGAMLDVQDVQLLVLGLLAVGWPAGLIFLATTFLLAVVGMIGLVILKKKSVNDRLIITPYIIPAAILTLFFGSWAMRLTHLDKIRF